MGSVQSNVASGAAQAPPLFWRSLEDLSDTDEFRQWISEEFPGDWATGVSGVSRRQMLKLTAASFVLAGVEGCRKPPNEKIVPPVRLAGMSRAGKPTYFATSVAREGFAQGVLVKTQGGRPVKV